MSLIKWLKSAKSPSLPGLPDPKNAVTVEEAIATEAANDAVEAIFSEPPPKRQRGGYAFYSAEIRAKIGKSACEIGNTKTVKKFTIILGKKLNESTVRSMKKAYIEAKQRAGDDVPDLPRRMRGQPLLLGDLDTVVQSWIRKVRVAGGVINVQIVMAASLGIVKKCDRKRLAEFGGNIRITKTWAQSLLKRMGFVKRKGTKDAKKLPNDFDVIKADFLRRVDEQVVQHDIPDELVFNMDQSGGSLVPGGEWTMEQEGARQVPITGIDDKRQITAVLTVSKTGRMLPTQLIYAGTTKRCLPQGVDFPDGWHITHTETHWSNTSTMLTYIDNIILPYVEKKRIEMGKPEQKALLILDHYRAHRVDAMKEKMINNGVCYIYVPACCTDRLQPLDLTVNKDFKDELKNSFQNWYADEVVAQMDKQEEETGETDATHVHVDLRLSRLKPIHANWLVLACQAMETKPRLIRDGFRKAGLLD